MTDHKDELRSAYSNKKLMGLIGKGIATNEFLCYYKARNLQSNKTDAF